MDRSQTSDDVDGGTGNSEEDEDWAGLDGRVWRSCGVVAAVRTVRGGASSNRAVVGSGLGGALLDKTDLGMMSPLAT